MPKANPLSKGLAGNKSKAATKASKAAKTVEVVPANGNGNGSARSRVLIGGHFAPAVQIELKIICAKERKTMQMILTEALNMLLAKYGQPEIAGIAPEESAA
jgi:hypothetical protein